VITRLDENISSLHDNHMYTEKQHIITRANTSDVNPGTVVRRRRR